MLQTKKEKFKRNTTTKNAYFILHLLLSYNEFRVDIIKTLLACNTLKIEYRISGNFRIDLIFAFFTISSKSQIIEFVLLYLISFSLRKVLNC